MSYSLTEFRFACVQYLSSLSLMSLRAYGRHVGVARPTEKKKIELIDEIVGILTGELQPVARASKGAPVKDDFVDPKIEEKIAHLRQQFLTKFPTGIGEEQPQGKRKNFFLFADSDGCAIDPETGRRQVFVGQLDAFKNVPCLISTDGDLTKERIMIKVEDILAYDLREGDVISCYAKEYEKFLLVADINAINSVFELDKPRFHFEEEPSVYPCQRLPLLLKDRLTPEQKFLDWLLPIGVGQRCLVASSPKSGKSTFLYNLANSIDDLKGDYEPFALLIDQSPELISRYRSVLSPDNVLATTYDVDENTHVFMAEFMLKRMKRFAESGRHVILIVDSLSKLARAYNDTEFSMGGKRLPCGLESKTLHYLKKFFGAARTFGEKGSLTIVAAVSFGTGDEVDDVLYSELSAVAGAEIRLCDELALKRLFPAVDLLRSHFEQSDVLMDEKRRACDELLRQKAISRMPLDEVHRAIVACESIDELYDWLQTI